MKRFLLYSMVVILAGTAIAAFAATALIIWASNDLPSFTKVSDYRPPQVTTVYARDGSVLGYFYDEKRFLITLSQMAPMLPKAFIAVEDDQFYNHSGVDPVAIVSAFIDNMRSGRKTRGGSTITQQLIKRLVLSPEQTYTRKLKEAILAYRLEKYLSKDEILNIYLNQIYLGSGAYGVEAAARTYFGKHAEELTMAECAVIAGLARAPSDVNPYRDPARTKIRQHVVLQRMLTVGFITQAEYQAALSQPLAYRSTPDPSWKLGAWYLEEVRRYLIDYLSEANVHALKLPLDRFGRDALYNAGLNIYTGMDPEHQQAAETSLRQGLWEAARRYGWNGPIANIPAPERDKFLKDNPFSPQDLDDSNWVKALVERVTPAGLEVRLGTDYKGFIDAKSLAWTRNFNSKVAEQLAEQQRNANRPVLEGDAIWVSAVGAKGTSYPAARPAKEGKEAVPAYDPSTVAPAKPIALSLEQEPIVQGAVSSIETKTGDLVALVGGWSYKNSQFNRATQARRQPGSSFKAVVYSAALDHGFTAASMILDSPFVIPGEDGAKIWRPGNFDGVFYGPTLLRNAIARSRNLCTVRVDQQVGMDAVVERAHQLGITGNIPQELAISLGAYALPPLSMAEAYTAFATGGLHVKPRMITAITNVWGKTIQEFPPQMEQVITPQNAYLMASLLKDVVNAGTATRVKVLGRPVAGKTGTSNEERDAWFIGFTPYLVSSIYIGNDDMTPLGKQETGGRTAIPVFIYYHQAVDAEYPPDDFPVPPDIVMKSIDADTGLLSGPHTQKSLSLPFIAGTEPRQSSGQSAPKDSGEDLLKQMF